MIGAFLQYYLSRKLEQGTHRQNLRTQAYVDLLQGVAGIATSIKFGAKFPEMEHTTLLTAAKQRVSIYGSKEVIEVAANFWRAGGELNTPEQMALYVKMVQAMREDSLPNDLVSGKDVSQLLFGREV